MSGLRCLALDADASALAEISYMLETDSRVSHLSNADNIHDASQLISTEAIDAVFVCLVHHTAAQVDAMLSSLKIRPQFVAIARDSFQAIDAFEFGAVDYMIKPLSRKNLDRALHRLESALATPATAPVTITRVSAERAGATYFLDARDILRIEAAGDYTVITTAQGEFTSRDSLSALADALAPLGFARVHRSWVVPLHRVEAFAQECGRTSVTIAGFEVPVARRCTKEIKERLL